MKNNLCIIACLSTTLIYAMETTETVSLRDITETSLRLTFNETEINLTKGSICNADKPIPSTVIGKYQQKSTFVVGNHQQRILLFRQNGHFYDYFSEIGNIQYSNDDTNFSYERNKDNDNASDDDTYHPHPHLLDKQEYCTCHKMNNLILFVEEPCIGNSISFKATTMVACDSPPSETITDNTEPLNDFIYYVHRKTPNTHVCSQLTFTGSSALTEAEKDLILCYNNCLAKDSEYISQSKDNIIFTTLGTDVGFPRRKAAPIAVATVLEFIKNNPKAYKSISFLVKKNSDFALYKELLMASYKQLHILYLYFAHRDKSNFLSTIPFEIINHIALLAFNS